VDFILVTDRNEKRLKPLQKRSFGQNLYFPRKERHIVHSSESARCAWCFQNNFFNFFPLCFYRISSWKGEFHGNFTSFVWRSRVKHEKFGRVHVAEHHQIDFSQFLEFETKHRRARKIHFPSGASSKTDFYPIETHFFFEIFKRIFFVTKSYTHIHTYTWYNFCRSNNSVLSRDSETIIFVKSSSFEWSDCKLSIGVEIIEITRNATRVMPIF